VTGPARDLLTRSGLRTAQPQAAGRPPCWRDLAHDDGQSCALCYTADMQQGLLHKSPGCEGCWAGINAAALYYTYRKVLL
jgi:hypothetical protein